MKPPKEYAGVKKRHSWTYRKVRVGMSDQCKRCGCIKEVINGRITYFLNDNVTDEAPNCSSNNT